MTNISACLTSNTVEWYTPEKILIPVYEFFGEHGIDLDPCSNEGEPNVKAAKHFTKRDDGLSQEWSGNVYCNPPYGKNEIPSWVKKALNSKATTLLLVPSRTSNKWWSGLDGCPVCFVQGRLKFVGAENGAPFPSALFLIPSISADVHVHNMLYLRFFKIFSQIGSVRF